MYVFIFEISLGKGVAAYWEMSAYSAYDMFSKFKYLIMNVFPPRFFVVEISF